MMVDDFYNAVVTLKDGKSTVSIQSNNKDRVREFLADFANRTDKTDPPAAGPGQSSPTARLTLSDLECALSGADDWGHVSIILADRILHDSVGHMKAQGKTVSFKFPSLPQPFKDDVERFFDARCKYSLTITRIIEE